MTKIKIFSLSLVNSVQSMSHKKNTLTHAIAARPLLLFNNMNGPKLPYSILYTTTPCLVFVYQELTTCLCLLHLALNCPNPPLLDSMYARRSLCMLVAWLPTLHSSIHCHADTTVCMFVHSIHIKKGHGINMFNYPFIQITDQPNISSKGLRCFVKLKNKALPLY